METTTHFTAKKPSTDCAECNCLTYNASSVLQRVCVNYKGLSPLKLDAVFERLLLIMTLYSTFVVLPTVWVKAYLSFIA